MVERRKKVSKRWQSQLVTHAPSKGSRSEHYDSGASRHMSPYRHKFTIFRGAEPRSIAAADERTVYAIRMGDPRSQIPNGELFPSTMILKDVLYAPYMGLTMISTNYIATTGCKVNFEGETHNQERGRSANLRYHSERGLTERARLLPAARAGLTRPYLPVKTTASQQFGRAAQGAWGFRPRHNISP